MSERRAALLAALEWQIELGADEAIAEAPIDRFAAPEPVPAPEPATAPRAEPPPQAPAVRAAPAAAPSPAVESAATVAARADTLEALADAIAGWHGTELHLGARNCVFTDGLPGARLMVIGEAPGADEDRQGKPFVGRAGQLLDRMLAAIGLSRHAQTPEAAAYIANILPWRPPGNRTPSEAEVAAFLPFIERHIRLAKPEAILSVGNTPTKALLATTTGIKRMRGRWVEHPATGLPLMPSFHPAYLLRQPAEKALAWRDLQAVRDRLEGR